MSDESTNNNLGDKLKAGAVGAVIGAAAVGAAVMLSPKKDEIQKWIESELVRLNQKINTLRNSDAAEELIQKLEEIRDEVEAKLNEVSGSAEEKVDEIKEAIESSVKKFNEEASKFTEKAKE